MSDNGREMTEPVLPDQTRDDTDEGWREDVDDDVRRLVAERPPHHDRAD